MKKSVLFPAVGLLLFFVVMGIFIYHSEDDTLLRDPSSTKSKKTKKTKTEGRDMELGKFSQQTDKVADEPSALFNDPAINQAWGLKKSDAARAWSVTKGSRSIVVAVIDTGCDINHEDIKKNLWINPGESGKDKNGKDKSNNGIDDDGNGFVDDIHGWNFVSSNSNLADNHGHGTHIACTMGAEGGNGVGISGIAPEVSLMILKYFDPKVPNADNLKNTVSAIKYAVKMGANIINYSGGGNEYSQEEKDAVTEAEKKGILFVAAAGNERSNSDQHHYYPADYKLKNIISVTAIDPINEVLPSSNYGIETVDIAAPGQNILSCIPGNQYALMTGTSQATAFVSGAAALVMAHKKSYAAEEVKKYILATGDALNSLSNKTKTSRKLNLFKALTILDGGTTASGVMALNPVDGDFLSDPNAKKVTDPNLETRKEFSKFGRSLMEILEKEKKIPRMGQDNSLKQ